MLYIKYNNIVFNNTGADYVIDLLGFSSLILTDERFFLNFWTSRFETLISLK